MRVLCSCQPSAGTCFWVASSKSDDVDYIDPHVMVGAYPFARDVEGLYAEGVRAVCEYL